MHIMREEQKNINVIKVRQRKIEISEILLIQKTTQMANVVKLKAPNDYITN